MKIKNLKFQIVSLLFAICYLLFAIAPASALTMSNDNYILQTGEFNTAGGTVSDQTHKVNTTVGQSAEGLYTGENSKLKAGFQYLRTAQPFIFSISETLIDFGILSPTNPVIRKNVLKIRVTSPYSVTASQNHPLASPTRATIPDTTCDTGICSETIPSAWTSTLTYGFGYRCDNVQGRDCEQGFRTGNFFKQFADASRIEPAQAVMAGSSGQFGKVAQITYKVNIAGTQVPGLYSNTITYLAVPNF